jgi:hypothetical protein
MRAMFSLSIVFSLLLAVGAYVHAVENLIQNGDFEAGVDVGWAVAQRGAALMVVKLDTEEFVVGGGSARFEIKNTGAGGTHDLTYDCGTALSIKNGKTYTIDFWIKAEEERTICIDLLMNHPPWTRVQGFPVDKIPVTTEWEVRHHTFKADFSDGNMIFLFSFSRGTNVNPLATTWIDHVRFYEGKYEEEEDLKVGEPRQVEPGGKIAVLWARMKTRR